jgi:NAD(P)-dependent dehydrogenase (short-subunit alcohol dehydrogenase family)
MSQVLIERHKDTFLSRIPLHRFGNEQDLKGAAVFLASEAYDFVTGHVLVVDGGQTA